MVSSEDFSFPKIPNTLPHFAVSPSLWRVSSVVYPDLSWDDYHNGGGAMVVGEDDEEEKMDMLWEDFNEELQRVSSLGSNNKIKKMMKNCHSSGGRGRDHHQQQEKLLKTSSPSKSESESISGPLYATRSNKKQSLGSVLKLFKKILLHKSKR
ncbi:hypothetical protein M5689_012148 [Euphorbia peplus]|nr:hypothetical protein M5689_012148 [Euphorbia peplus]